MSDNKYVLITAARNEEKYIELPLRSVLSQTILPEKWVIVSDGSIDGTDEIIKRYQMLHPSVIKYVRRESSNIKADFSSKVYALHLGYESMTDCDYDYIGHLDADISLDEDYYEKLLGIFCTRKTLGLAGGFLYEPDGNGFSPHDYNNIHSIIGAVQLFRRGCYEAIGAFLPLKYGGEDWYAEIRARMLGWEVQAFPEYKVYHHKVSRSVRGVFQEKKREGLMDYSLGSHPVFEMLKCLSRMRQKPYITAGFVRWLGFLLGYMKRSKRQVTDDFVKYLRREQTKRITDFKDG